MDEVAALTPFPRKEPPSPPWPCGQEGAGQAAHPSVPVLGSGPSSPRLSLSPSPSPKGRLAGQAQGPTGGLGPCAACPGSPRGPPPVPPRPPPPTHTRCQDHRTTSGGAAHDLDPRPRFPRCARSQRVGGSSWRGDGAHSAGAYWVWRSGPACDRATGPKGRWAGGGAGGGRWGGGGRQALRLTRPAQVLEVPPAGLPALASPLPLPSNLPWRPSTWRRRGRPVPAPRSYPRGVLPSTS